MHMKLINPAQVRVMLARNQNWLTIKEVAEGLSKHPNTIRKVFSGDTVSEDTVRDIAAAIDKHPLDIAVFADA